MTLMDHLKDVCEHTDRSLYGGDVFPLYIVVRFFSFISPTYAVLLNNTVNSPVWYEMDGRSQKIMLKAILPKMRYNYQALFSGYVKAPKKVYEKDETDLIKTVAEVFEVSLEIAEMYLEFGEFKEKMVRLVKDN